MCQLRDLRLVQSRGDCPRPPPWRVAQRYSPWICYSLESPSEYIIGVLTFVDSRRTLGCRTLVLFKGAGFDFSGSGLPCATLCGASMDAVTSISSPSVVIDGVLFLEPPVLASALLKCWIKS